MKKVLFVIFSLTLLVSCSVKTNEEKARDLIEPEVKAHLIKPESYEFAKIKLDSCFNDSQYNPDFLVISQEIAKLYKEYQGYISDAERAESSMTTYAPSYGYQSAHDKQQHKKYKAELEKAKYKAATTKDKILQIFKENNRLFTVIEAGTHEFIGWTVSLCYRAETAGGIKVRKESLFYLNKDFSEITHFFSEDDLKLFRDESLEDFEYEFENDIKDILGK